MKKGAWQILSPLANQLIMTLRLSVLAIVYKCQKDILFLPPLIKTNILL